MIEYWKNKRVLITGGTGFLGQHVVEELKTMQPEEIVSIGSKDFDLRNYESCLKATKNIDLVIHLAANVGGIGYNQEKPADLFEDNLLMGTFMMKAAKENKVEKFVALGTVCAYPKVIPIPFKEDDLWNGYPEETNAPYGLAKKMLLVQSQAYRQQFDFNSIYLLPVNLYGPGDNFNPKSSHVIPALIKKFIDAKANGDNKVVVWGTGSATREFLFVKDAARAIVLAAEKYDKSDPVNIGSSFEISIKDLAELIKRLVDFNGEIEWDTTKPDGQPRRKLDVSRAEREFGFVSKTTFEEGLQQTIDWYINTLH